LFQHCLARALYDNVPDTPDELAFQKGDTLIVLEQNTANIEGWWLCMLKGRQVSVIIRVFKGQKCPQQKELQLTKSELPASSRSTLLL